MAEDTTTDTAAADDLADWGEAMAEQGVDPGAAAAEPAPATAAPKVQPASFAELRADQGGAAANNNNQLDLVMDIPVTLSVELGRTKIQIRELLQLAQGSVVDLDRLAGEPMDVLVNGFLIARGEVVLVNDKFGIRLTDIVSPAERARRLA
ncbi:MAG: flagellar motor switch protein FliN [Thiomonas sp.]